VNLSSVNGVFIVGKTLGYPEEMFFTGKAHESGRRQILNGLLSESNAEKNRKTLNQTTKMMRLNMSFC
jgi:hypothetical protein